MFEIEKLISKSLPKWIESGGKDDYGRAKVVLSSYFIVHLISVGLMSWMLYRLLIQKKKDGWSLGIFI
ncbi:MAG: hypothetical protein MRERC_5c091 [Mycoplasmataceae bacterium RC_NB112A]|nr:MAG: hypothetical protein MRERC_5c091 [Mycoplasmataceae bacterium RC_NB112A]